MRNRFCSWWLPLAMLVAPAFLHAQAVITLDSNVTYQVMRGWEVGTYVSAPCEPYFAALRDSLVRIAVDDVGINRLRLEVRSGAENTVDYYARWVADGCPEPPDSAYYSWRRNRYATVNDNPYPNSLDEAGFHFTELDWDVENIVMPMRQRLEARGERLFVNLLYVAFTGQIEGGEYHHDEPEEYAEFMLAAFLHLRRKYNLVPDALEVILEPDNVRQWSGTTVGEAIIAVVDKLAERGFHPRIIAPSCSSTGAAVSYFNRLAQVTGALDKLDVYSYHRYGASLSDVLKIAAAARQYGLETAMLEFWFGRATYEVLFEDLVEGMNSAWQGRVLRGLFMVATGETTVEKITYNSDTKYNRQVFRFVRMGAVRIGARSDAAKFVPIAFINPDGGRVVVIKASSGGAFSIRGLPPGAYSVKYTLGSAGEEPFAYDVNLPDATVSPGGTLDAAIPDRGLITVYPWEKPLSVRERRGVADWKAILIRNYPNPFRSSTVIAFDLAATGCVDLAVFDRLGRRLRTLRDGMMNPGAHRVAWDGTDDAGRLAPAGVYVVRLRAGKALAHRTLVVLQ